MSEILTYIKWNTWCLRKTMHTVMKFLTDVNFTSQNAFSEEWRGHENCFPKVPQKWKLQVNKWEKRLIWLVCIFIPRFTSHLSKMVQFRDFLLTTVKSNPSGFVQYYQLLWNISSNVCHKGLIENSWSHQTLLNFCWLSTILWYFESQSHS